jgi:hypothetical protein
VGTRKALITIVMATTLCGTPTLLVLFAELF